MEDSFSVRVERVFGSLSSSAKPLTTPSLWSLTDEEIEKKEWSRDTGIPDDADGDGASVPSDVDGFFANRNSLPVDKQPRGLGLKELEDDLQILDEGAEESVPIQRRSRESDEAGADDENDEWEIRNSIGMDCTLDYEDEEDKYDKVAVGDEERGDRIYMREINDYGIHVSTFSEIPTSFREAGRDPRANHLAAKLRLKEDEEAAKDLSPLQISSEMEMSTHDYQISSFDERNHLKKSSPNEMIMGAQQDQNNVSEAGKQVKSILKRKEDQTGSTPVKKVRFVPDCKEDNVAGDAMVSLSNKEESSSLRRDSLVPDYLQNPSKYKCYTFNETDDLDEKSNQQGYMDLLNAIRKSKQPETDEPPADLSQRVIFNPKKKAKDASLENIDDTSEQHKDITVQEVTKKKSLPAIIADEDTEESDVCAMEEDTPQIETNRSNSRNRTSRQYRSKITEELDESGP
ncbi:hypothetical protein V2J09_005982 [Rumex salicifolius]